MSLRGAVRAATAVAALALCAGTLSRAGDDIVLSGTLTLDQAIKTAVDNNLDLKSAYQQREVARGRRLESWGEALPKVDLDGRYTRQGKAAGILDVTGAFIPFGYQDTTTFDLLLTQPLWQGGRAQAALRASNLYKAYTEEDLRSVVQSVVYRTSLAYWAAVVGQQQYKVAVNALDLATVHLKDVETKKKYGVASQFNVLRSEVEVSNASAQAIAIKNAVHLATTALFRVMGVSQNSEVDLTEALQFVPVAPAEDGELRTALSTRPEIALAEYTMKLQKEAVNVAKADFYPKFELFAGETYAKPNPAILNSNSWGDNWRIGLHLTFPVFDGFARSGRLIQEKARFEQRKIDAADARERTRSDVRAAIRTLEDAAESVTALQKTIEQANEGLRLAEVGYREGTLDQVAVIDARGALTLARLNYDQGIYRHIVAKLELERVRGTLGAVYQPAATARATAGR
jgi:outer membrane protein